MRKPNHYLIIITAWIVSGIFLFIFSRDELRLWRYDSLLHGKNAVVIETKSDLAAVVLFKALKEKLVDDSGIIKKISLWYKNAVQAEVGVASWYGRDFQGKLTASGTRYNMFQMTCAHRTLPFGTRILVTNLSNVRSVIVTVTDRGPFWCDKVRLRRKGIMVYVPIPRILDLSLAAAQELDMVKKGIDKVSIIVVL